MVHHSSTRKFYNVMKIPYVQSDSSYKSLILKCHPKNNFSINISARAAKENKSTKYKTSILFPTTKFPSNLNGRKRIENENNVRKIANFDLLYATQEKSNKEEYILHDGPPYANGKLHMGHALNKILKDVTVRYKYLKGYKVNFTPGWDCHGLPIELKALDKAQEKGETSGNWENLTPLEIRNRAKTLAEEHLLIQKKSFEKWGLFVNWKNYYCTSNPSYIAKQLKLFNKLYDNGFIFQDYMPVHFSPSSRTSIAESELEYNNEHESPSLYLALPVSEETKEEVFGSSVSVPVYIGIWTTTPWTLPANAAVCFNEGKNYTLLRTNINGKSIGLLWITDRIEDLPNLLKSSFQIVTTIEGQHLKNLKYLHPLNGSLCPVLPGSHVSSEKGTGFVHTAPAHGKEDFVIALQNQIPTDIQLIDDTGCYKKEAGELLFGKYVLEEGNSAVMSIINDMQLRNEVTSPVVINLGKIIHAYPYDWRTKKPTIIRASKQWFFDVNKMKQSAVDALKDVKIYPERLRKRFLSLIEGRPYWCLSRQRVWGVPIPVFYDSRTGEPIVKRQIIDHICSLMEKEGSDVWWKYSERQLLPPEYVQEYDSQRQELPRKGTDILDIWFDSGSSWYCALNGEKADLYMEGHDQANGWFHSSLLISVAATGGAPYKELFLHGFTIDEHRQKMSKSLRNTFDPNLITDGGRNLKTSPAFGVNVLRWWTLSSSPIYDVPFGMKIIESCEKDVKALRNTFSFYLGSLNNFTPASQLQLDELRLTDQYLLSLIKPYLEKVWNHYENFEYEKIPPLIYDFVVQEVGNNYMNSAKDILYFEREDSPRRRSIQTVLYLILPYFLRSLEPVLPLLVTEVNSYLNDIGGINSHSVTNTPPVTWNQFENLSRVRTILNIKDDFENKILEINEEALKEGKVVDTIKYRVCIKADKLVGSTLKVRPILLFDYVPVFSDRESLDLCAVLRVSEVTVDADSSIPDGYELIISEADGALCHRCRKFTTCDKDLCSRCESVLKVL